MHRVSTPLQAYIKFCEIHNLDVKQYRAVGKELERLRKEWKKSVSVTQAPLLQRLSTTGHLNRLCYVTVSSLMALLTNAGLILFAHPHLCADRSEQAVVFAAESDGEFTTFLESIIFDPLPEQVYFASYRQLLR